MIDSSMISVSPTVSSIFLETEVPSISDLVSKLNITLSDTKLESRMFFDE